jgi:hypothetical protein
MKGRNESIRQSLDAMEETGQVRSWYAYAPGDRRGRRWVVECAGIGTQVFSTAEVETFILGSKPVMFAGS